MQTDRLRRWPDWSAGIINISEFKVTLDGRWRRRSRTDWWASSGSSLTRQKLNDFDYNLLLLWFVSSCVCTVQFSLCPFKFISQLIISLSLSQGSLMPCMTTDGALRLWDRTHIHTERELPAVEWGKRQAVVKTDVNISVKASTHTLAENPWLCGYM